MRKARTRLTSFNNRRIDKVTKVLSESSAIRGRDLRHDNNDSAFDRIDKKASARRTIPPDRAFLYWIRIRRWIEHNVKATETPTRTKPIATVTNWHSGFGNGILVNQCRCCLAKYSLFGARDLSPI